MSYDDLKSWQFYLLSESECQKSANRKSPKKYFLIFRAAEKCRRDLQNKSVAQWFPSSFTDFLCCKWKSQYLTLLLLMHISKEKGKYLTFLLMRAGFLSSSSFSKWKSFVEEMWMPCLFMTRLVLFPLFFITKIIWSQWLSIYYGNQTYLPFIWWSKRCLVSILCWKVPYKHAYFKMSNVKADF